VITSCIFRGSCGRYPTRFMRLTPQATSPAPRAVLSAKGSAEDSIQPKYLPNADCPRGGAHWTPPRNLLVEFSDYVLQGTSLAAQGLYLRTQVGNF